MLTKSKVKLWLVPLDLVVAFAVVGGMDSTHVLKVTKDVGSGF